MFGLRQDRALVAYLNGYSSIMQLISTAFFIGICIKHGFGRPYKWALNVVMISVIAYGAIYFTDWSNATIWVALMVITTVFGLSTGGVYYIPWTVYTFLADVDEVMTGRRREGIYAGAMTFAGKMTRSVIVFLMGWVLSLYGFQSGQATQPPSAEYAIIGVFTLGVIGLAVLGVIYASQMKLDRKNHVILLEEIERIKAGGAIADIPAHARVIAEELTGWKYEQCWGNNPAAKLIQLNKEQKLKTA